ncbi:hypothetical protein EG835_12405 [bacterium]|nr:hypothetical protein [bacterium]
MEPTARAGAVESGETEGKGAARKAKKTRTKAARTVDVGGKSLVIVESPAKAKTISKYLGKGFVVEASVGHIKNLPKSKIGVDVDRGFVPEYETISGKDDVIVRLKDHAAKAGEVFIATDPDREGEAIAWHIARELEPVNDRIHRVLFHEITERTPARTSDEVNCCSQTRSASQSPVGLVPNRERSAAVSFLICPILSRSGMTARIAS